MKKYHVQNGCHNCTNCFYNKELDVPYCKKRKKTFFVQESGICDKFQKFNPKKHLKGNKP